MRATKQESVVVVMKKPSALIAWKMLVLSLPKGIAAFVIVVAGLSAGLPLSVFLIGLPLLAGALAFSRSIMLGEMRYATAWLQRKEYPEAAATSEPAVGEQQGWRSWLSSVFKDGRSYRSILFGLMQLPIGIAAFTFAIVLPVTALAVMLSPAAYEVSMRLFEFNLFETDWRFDELFGWDMNSAQRSWVAGGVGLLLMLLMPPIMRGLGHLYAAWILSIAGPEPAQRPDPEAAQIGGKFPFAMENHDIGNYQLDRGAPPVS